MRTMNDRMAYSAALPSPGRFFDKLTPGTMNDLMTLVHPVQYDPNEVLFSEQEQPLTVFVILEGQVRLSMNSADGKRLILRVATKGEIVGVSSLLCGKPHEMTAETVYPSKLAPIGRNDFMKFLLHHSDAYQTLTEEISREFSMACERLRTVVLSSTASQKLARLLLNFSESGQTSELGTRFRFCMTHEEIGECIGTSRETVSRTLGDFKSRRLVTFQGSTLTIPSKMALRTYACA